MAIDLTLLEKYDQPVPRYTSYPTVPYWQQGLSLEPWKLAFQEAFHKVNGAQGISLYIHLPFCEALCTYCGCNKKITTNHSVEERYLEAIRKEWAMYRSLMGEPPLISQIHLGGGTPTFFSAAHLSSLIHSLLEGTYVHPHQDFSFEGHPNNTTREHLEALYQQGFRRVSYGVQDLDPTVQKVINRIQPFEHLHRATAAARAVGYHSINFDLIYGLPLQTMSSIEKTIQQSLTLHPDRVAFYSYAHVPWTSKGQRLFDERDLPSPEQKLGLYQQGKSLFQAAGYQHIGMDHFSLKTDGLYVALKKGQIHRNFMGYTTQKSSLLLGLGVSSISDLGNGYGQNYKTLSDYYKSVEAGVLPITKGHFLTALDERFRNYIMEVICQGSTRFRSEDRDILKTYSFPMLEQLAQDQLILFTEETLEVTPLGRNFLRNICSAFDLHLLQSPQKLQMQNITLGSSRGLYSKSV